jgi:hypothetical protein
MDNTLAFFGWPFLFSSSSGLPGGQTDKICLYVSGVVDLRQVDKHKTCPEELVRLEDGLGLELQGCPRDRKLQNYPGSYAVLGVVFYKLF